MRFCMGNILKSLIAIKNVNLLLCSLDKSCWKKGSWHNNIHQSFRHDVVNKINEICSFKMLNLITVLFFPRFLSSFFQQIN